jgi:alcohol dehydrogenase
MTPGADIAGEIVALGAEVDRAQWKVGDRVTVVPNQDHGMVGETLVGGASELFATEARYLLPVPDAVSFVDAACLPVAYGTALRMMETRAQLQLAKAAGCEVVACASSGARAERLRDIGADHIVDTSQQNYIAEIHKLYGKPRIRGGGGVDVIVNYTGGDTWAECFRALGRHGRLLTCGATAGFDPKTDLRYIWSFEFNIIGCNSWTRDDQIELLHRVADGRLEPIKHCELPLARFGEAMTDLMERRVFGKAVLIP